MRNWLFHPIIFYPLAILFAVLVVGISVNPQSWPRPAAAVAAERVQNALVFRGEAFNSPSVDAQQDMFVERDFWGRAQTLHIAQKPGAPAPTPAEQGARILLTPEDAALIANRPVTLEVSYNPLPVNPANGIAVSLQGASPAWVTQPARPQASTLRFELPAQADVSAIGIRALSDGTDQAYGLEITRIRVIPHT